MTNRISDSELLFLIAQGNLDAKKTLDKRYFLYCKTMVKKFLDSHLDYGYAYEDFLNAAMLGYCRARNKFNYELSDGFFPYFKIWAMSEMKSLLTEGNKFYLNENPNCFLSLDITYKEDESLTLSETFGDHDKSIMNDIRKNELLSLLADSSIGLTERELFICAGLIDKKTEKEIRENYDISYSQYRRSIELIRLKIGRRLEEIFK